MPEPTRSLVGDKETIKLVKALNSLNSRKDIKYVAENKVVAVYFNPDYKNKSQKNIYETENIKSMELFMKQCETRCNNQLYTWERLDKLNKNYD